MDIMAWWFLTMGLSTYESMMNGMLDELQCTKHVTCTVIPATKKPEYGDTDAFSNYEYKCGVSDEKVSQGI